MKHTAIRFDRSFINPKGDSVRYLEVSMDAPEPGRSSKRKRAPMDLALVIDRSGSMQGEPLAAARKAARGVAQQLRAKDTLSVVVFDDSVDILFEGLSMTKAGKTRADAMLAGIHSGGMTCLSEGWLAGAEAVAGLGEGEDGRRSQ
ncbi:MAG: VWA domain-containing protein, partial [Planctomycetota bacterium]|nr:VWA domain-containing protein [Planctomycetota bacterium]